MRSQQSPGHSRVCLGDCWGDCSGDCAQSPPRPASIWVIVRVIVLLIRSWCGRLCSAGRTGLLPAAPSRRTGLLPGERGYFQWTWLLPGERGFFQANGATSSGFGYFQANGATCGGFGHSGDPIVALPGRAPLRWARAFVVTAHIRSCRLSATVYRHLHRAPAQIRPAGSPTSTTASAGTCSTRTGWTAGSNGRCTRPWPKAGGRGATCSSSGTAQGPGGAPRTGAGLARGVCGSEKGDSRGELRRRRTRRRPGHRGVRGRMLYRSLNNSGIRLWLREAARAGQNKSEE